MLNAHLAYGDAVLLELLGQDGVEEGVAARVEGQDEDGEDLGLLQGDQVEPSASRQGEKGDGSPKDIIKILNFTRKLRKKIIKLLTLVMMGGGPYVSPQSVLFFY